MAITPYTNIGRIDWLRTDPVAEAKAARSRRQSEALGQLGGGVKRGVSNYMKGGVRGMIDPEYAEEQKKARMENAELDARLAAQETDAADQSKQPQEQGTPTLEPVIKPTEDRSWLSQLGETSVGGVARKVWRGPSGAPVNLQELAAKRGRAKAFEDKIKLVDAASRALMYAEDPGGAVAGIMGKGVGGLRGIKPKPMEPSGGDKDSFYVQEYNDAKDQGRPFDMNRVIAAREAAAGRTKERDEAIEKKYETPPVPRAKSLMEEARDLAVKEYGPNPTAKQIEKKYRGLSRTGSRGGGSKAFAHEVIAREREAQGRETARMVGANPNDWQHFVGVKDPEKARDIAAALKERDDRERAAKPPAAEPPTPTPHGTAGGPDPTGQRRNYDGKPSAPLDDVNIFQEP